MDGAHKTHNKWLVTVTVMTGAMMAALDTSIVNVALPHMRGALDASVEEIAWVSTGYILSSVIVMPIIALLSSRFGRKRFFLFSVILFTSSSMLCGAAWDLPSMIVFRVLQGIGGGTLIPLAQALLRETFPAKEQATAMSIFGLGVILGPAFGPTLGGWLTDNYSWPWIFYINVPVGILNVLLIMRFVEDPHYLVREKGSIDATGLFLMAVGLGSLQVMLEKGDQKDWFTSDMIRYLAAAALAGLILFVIRELRAKRPAVNLRILKDINFASSSFMGGILSMGLFASLFVLPLFLAAAPRLPCLRRGAGAYAEEPRDGFGYAFHGLDIPQDRTPVPYSPRASRERRLVLPPVAPFPGRRVLGHILPSIPAGHRLRSDIRGIEHGRALYDR